MFLKFQKAVIIIVACEYYPNGSPNRALYSRAIYPTGSSFSFWLWCENAWRLRVEKKYENPKYTLQIPCLNPIYSKNTTISKRIYSVLHQCFHPKIIIEARTKICRHRYIYRMTLDSAMSCFYSVGKEKLKLLNLYLIFPLLIFLGIRS